MRDTTDLDGGLKQHRGLGFDRRYAVETLLNNKIYSNKT